MQLRRYEYEAPAKGMEASMEIILGLSDEEDLMLLDLFISYIYIPVYNAILDIKIKMEIGYEQRKRK